MASKRPEVLLLVGMSGAGRSSSSNVFEDRREFEMALLTLWLDFLPKSDFEDHLPKR